MTEENIFVNKLLFSLNISDFSLSLCKNCTPHPHPEKSHPYLPQQPPSKNCVHVKPPFPHFSFWKFGRRFNPPAEMERFTLCFPDIQYLIFGLQLCPINHKNCRSWNLKTHISSDVTSMNMKCSILARSWKFKKTRDNILLQIPFQSLTGKQKNSLLSTSRHINNITA